jgi:soluble lytic murein transglycosylase-like protein
MDGDVHLYSRQALLRRLCFYLILIFVSFLLTPTLHRNAVADPGFLGTLVEAEFQASYPFTIVDQTTESITAAAEKPSEKIKPAKAAVKVKLLYRTIIQQASRRYGVESAMIKAIIMAESSYNPRAVSSRGAAGLMQLMPTTADSMGVKDKFDPKHNIDGGVRYFKNLLVRFDGDIRLALAAYNAGAKKVRQYNGIPPYKATRSYINKVFQYYQRYKDLENDNPNKV